MGPCTRPVRSRCACPHRFCMQPAPQRKSVGSRTAVVAVPTTAMTAACGHWARLRFVRPEHARPRSSLHRLTARPVSAGSGILTLAWRLGDYPSDCIFDRFLKPPLLLPASRRAIPFAAFRVNSHRFSDASTAADGSPWSSRVVKGSTTGLPSLRHRARERPRSAAADSASMGSQHCLSFGRPAASLPAAAIGRGIQYRRRWRRFRTPFRGSRSRRSRRCLGGVRSFHWCSR